MYFDGADSSLYHVSLLVVVLGAAAVLARWPDAACWAVVVPPVVLVVVMLTLCIPTATLENGPTTPLNWLWVCGWLCPSIRPPLIYVLVMIRSLMLRPRPPLVPVTVDRRYPPMLLVTWCPENARLVRVPLIPPLWTTVVIRPSPRGEA